MLNKLNTTMKKIILMFAAVVMAAGVMSAQDINQATESYNNGAMELQMGNNGAALEYFQSALTMGEALGEEGADLVANCKKAICSTNLAMAKELYNAKDFAGAVAAFEKTKEIAEGYGEAEIAADAAELIGQANLLKLNTEGQAALKAKDYATAITCFTEVLAIEPDNANAALQLGQAYMRAKKYDESLAALETAKANGQEANAVKLISQNYLKMAQAAVKAKKFQEAVDFAAKSNSYVESANAYRMAASAYQQLNNTAECIASYEKYLELNPNAKDATGVKYTIAALAQTAGNKEKAKEYYQMILTDPQYGATAKQMLEQLK